MIVAQTRIVVAFAFAVRAGRGGGFRGRGSWPSFWAFWRCLWEPHWGHLLRPASLRPFTSKKVTRHPIKATGSRSRDSLEVLEPFGTYRAILECSGNWYDLRGTAEDPYRVRNPSRGLIPCW